MAFLFFASFLALARGWKNRVPAHPESADYGKHNARASIVFALFSSIAWVSISLVFFTNELVSQFKFKR